MKKIQREALVSLPAGIGFIVLLVGILTDLIPFTYALVAALVIWILGAVMEKQLKKRKTAHTIAGVLGIIGFAFLLLGIFTPMLEFLHGLLIAIVFWVITGVVKKWFGLK
jgi:hypothetical protein